MAGVEGEEDGLRLELVEPGVGPALELLVVHAVGGFVDFYGEAAAEAGDANAGWKMRCGSRAEDGEAEGFEAGERPWDFRALRKARSSFDVCVRSRRVVASSRRRRPASVAGRVFTSRRASSKSSCTGSQGTAWVDCKVWLSG